VTGPPRLDYAVPQEPEPTKAMSGFAVTVIGLVLSWGPAGIVLAVIVGRVGGELHERGSPRPDAGIPSLMIGLMTYPIVGALGTLASVLLGYRAHRRDHPGEE
jgi:hypothetical protein